jgi:hypothetical protein
MIVCHFLSESEKILFTLFRHNTVMAVIKISFFLRVFFIIAWSRVFTRIRKNRLLLFADRFITCMIFILAMQHRITLLNHRQDCFVVNKMIVSLSFSQLAQYKRPFWQGLHTLWFLLLALESRPHMLLTRGERTQQEISFSWHHLLS